MGNSRSHYEFFVQVIPARNVSLTPIVLRLGLGDGRLDIDISRENSQKWWKLRAYSENRILHILCLENAISVVDRSEYELSETNEQTKVITFKQLEVVINVRESNYHQMELQKQYAPLLSSSSSAAVRSSSRVDSVKRNDSVGSSQFKSMIGEISYVWGHLTKENYIDVKSQIAEINTSNPSSCLSSDYAVDNVEDNELYFAIQADGKCLAMAYGKIVEDNPERPEVRRVYIDVFAARRGAGDLLMPMILSTHGRFPAKKQAAEYEEIEFLLCSLPPTKDEEKSRKSPQVISFYESHGFLKIPSDETDNADEYVKKIITADNRLIPMHRVRKIYKDEEKA